MLGVAAYLAILGALALFVAFYLRVFATSTDVTVQSPRVGLLTESGSTVTFHGVDVGRVDSIATTGSGSSLAVSLDPKYTSRIPADVSARIEPNTLLGAKSVELVAPAATIAPPIASGAIIRTADVNPEFNTVFENLTSLLDAVKPVKINAALGAVAEALNGRGNTLGDTVERFDRYADGINPSIAQLGADFSQTARTADIYQNTTPNILRVLANLTVTGGTIVDQQRPLAALWTDVSRTSHDMRGFLSDARPDLLDAIYTLDPVGRLLADYSPEFSCTVRGFNNTKNIFQKTWGSNGYSVVAMAGVAPAVRSYRYPIDLPTNNATNGPSCYGLPLITKPVPRYTLDTGAHFWDGHNEAYTVDPWPSLFGSDASKLPGAHK
jgi:phospholipid/cholesterol/gamma-HCH transport system substrate-binding protein